MGKAAEIERVFSLQNFVPDGARAVELSNIGTGQPADDEIIGSREAVRDEIDRDGCYILARRLISIASESVAEHDKLVASRIEDIEEPGILYADIIHHRIERACIER